jgi:hypothetical protein
MCEDKGNQIELNKLFHDHLGKILSAEVNCTGDHEYFYRQHPIELEDTFLGNKLSDLLNLILIDH